LCCIEDRKIFNRRSAEIADVPEIFLE